MIRAIAGHDREIARWVGDRLGIDDFSPFCGALGIIDDHGIIAGVVFNNYRHPNIEATIASTTPRWCTSRVLRGIFSYPFWQLKCSRVTAVTSVKNQPTQAFLCRIGFQQEGVMRRAFRNDEDAVIFGMLAEECRWLQAKEPRHVEIRCERAESC